MSDPRVTVELLDKADLSLKATLSEAWGKQFQDVLGDTGMGKCTLGNDDPNLALVDYGDFLRFSLDGTHRFLSIVEKKDRVDVDDAEEVAEATTVSGRGALAVLEDGIVYPDLFIETVPFADARIFNFGAFLVGFFNYNGYINDASGYDWGVYTAAGPNYTNIPVDFPDTGAHWLGPETPDGSGNNPVGDWYLKTLLPGMAEGPYRLSLCADDSVEVYLDNVPIHKSEGVFGRLITIDLWLDQGLHDLNFKVTNLPLPLFGGPTGIIWSLAEINPDGTLGSVIWHSDPSTGSLDYYLPYPATPPGVTVGTAVFILVREAQQRGCFPLLTWDFDDDVDSAGVPWADIIQPSFQIGTDLLTALRQLTETYGVARMDPSALTLSLYQSYGTATGVVYAEAANIIELKHQGTI